MQSSLDPFGIPGKNDYSTEAKQARLEFIAAKTSQNFQSIPASNLRSEDMKGRIENFIGAIQIPLGLAGPLQFKGKEAQGMIYGPFATTEGALVASACRGSKLLTASGGVTTRVISQSLHRAPSFMCANLDQAIRLKDFILQQRENLSQMLRDISRYTKLVDIDPFLNGRTLHCILHFETGDAAGQNMVTVAGDHLGRWIFEQANIQANIEIKSYHVEGGMNGDKKVNFYSFIKGRGIRVAAEAFVNDACFAQQFKMSAASFYEHYLRGAAASTLAGSIGLNVNIANVLGAMFVATGQDVGSVHESSIGYLHIEREGHGLYCCLTLPSLLIGTVGGGTSLPTQKEALDMISCYGPGKKVRLAEIMAGFCLALDLSTWSSIANQTFTASHMTLGRP